MSLAQLKVGSTVLVLLLSSRAVSTERSETQVSPGELRNLVKITIQNELDGSNARDAHWKYLMDKEAEGKSETREVIETKSGAIDGLVATNGNALTKAQQQNEIKRILRLSHNPNEQRKLDQARQKDEQQTRAFLQLIPDAFTFDYAEKNGDSLKMSFKPDPRFRPSSREGKVLHEMAGEMWINGKQKRIVSISAQLLKDVKFGMLAHLEKGGQFRVNQIEVAPGDWEIADMTVNMRGKALLFKTISVQHKEVHRKFQRVPADLTTADAAALLAKQLPAIADELARARQKSAVSRHSLLCFLS